MSEPRLIRAEPVDKSPDAFRTISEVAVDLDLPQHVLRFWETRFVQIRPLKRGGGRRYYRPDDVELLKGIRHLLYGEGYTIRGVQRILKEQGVRFVMTVWKDGAPQPPPAGERAEPSAHESPEPAGWDDEGEDEAALPSDDAYSPYAPHRAVAPSEENGGAGDDGRVDPPYGEPEGVTALAQRFAPRLPTTDVDAGREPPRMPSEAPPAAAPRGEADPRPPYADDADGLSGLRASRMPAGLRPPASEPPRVGIGQFLDRLRTGAGRDAEPAAAAVRAGPSLSRDEIRRLQSTLFELLECKRLLDQAR